MYTINMIHYVIAIVTIRIIILDILIEIDARFMFVCDTSIPSHLLAMLGNVFMCLGLTCGL